MKKHLLSALLLAVATFLPACSTKMDASFTPQQVCEAALTGNLDTVKQALKQGYDPNSVDPRHRSALMYAAFNGHTKIAKLLIKRKADVNLQDSTGNSALMFAASSPFTDTVQLLLNHGAQINMADSNEHFTALMWAAAEGQLENVSLLLKHGADKTLQDIDGDTAESFAAQKGHAAVVALLKGAPAN